MNLSSEIYLRRYFEKTFFTQRHLPPAVLYWMVKTAARYDFPFKSYKLLFHAPSLKIPVVDTRYFSRDLCGIPMDLRHLLCTATARSIKWSIFRYFWLNLPKKNLWCTKNPYWFSGSPVSGKSHSPPTAHICFDRSFVPLSNVISRHAQSSLLMEFWGLENSAIKRVSRDPLSSDGSKIFFNILILIALMMRNPNLSSEYF